jgi:hypothetical protein
MLNRVQSPLPSYANPFQQETASVDTYRGHFVEPTADQRAELVALLRHCIKDMSEEEHRELSKIQLLRRAPMCEKVRGRRLVAFAKKAKESFPDWSDDTMCTMQTQAIENYMQSEDLTAAALQDASNRPF